MAADRLTALDASFLHLEDESSHMHVAGCSIFEGEPPDATRSCSRTSRGGCRWCRASARSCASCRSARGGPVWVDDPHFNLEYHVRVDRAAAARQRGAAEEPRQPRVRAAARPHEAAVGDLARRGPRARPARATATPRVAGRAAVRAPVQDAPRARRRRRRRGHHGGAVRHRAPSPRRRPGRARRGSRGPSRPRCSCSATR